MFGLRGCLNFFGQGSTIETLQRVKCFLCLFDHERSTCGRRKFFLTHRFDRFQAKTHRKKYQPRFWSASGRSDVGQTSSGTSSASACGFRARPWRVAVACCGGEQTPRWRRRSSCSTCTTRRALRADPAHLWKTSSQQEKRKLRKKSHFTYCCNFTELWCVKMLVMSDHGSIGEV